MRPQDIKSVRQLTGLNQTDFAKVVGVSLTTVNKWERGHAQLKKENVKKIERLVGSENLRVIQAKLLYDLPLLEVSDNLRKRANSKRGEIKQ